MRKTYKVAIARKFNALNFHDDNLKLVTVHPPITARNLTTIEFQFADHSTGATKILSFLRCANLRFSVDFDVLADNWFADTEGSTAGASTQKMREFVTTQELHWRTTYMPPYPKDKAIKKKLSSLRDYVLLKVKFFGGTVEILAKNFELKC